MADYPDWVLAHKRKGTYINKVGDKYYLYAAHSERIKGTNKVRRVSDGYLGRITEADGLIAPKDKFKDSEVPVYEFGVSFAVICCTKIIHAGLRKTFVKYGDLVYVASILYYIYGWYDKELFSLSYLQFHFPNLAFPDIFTDTQISGIERGARMISDTMKKTYLEDLTKIRAFFSSVFLVRMNGKLYVSSLSDTVKNLSDKYKIKWGDAVWQRSITS